MEKNIKDINTQKMFTVARIEITKAETEFPDID